MQLGETSATAMAFSRDGIRAAVVEYDGGSRINLGIYELDGTWGVEGHGVDPDIEVVDDPTLLARGEDPQLAAAIRVILEEVALNPWSDLEKPAYPDRSGAGLPEDEK